MSIVLTAFTARGAMLANSIAQTLGEGEVWTLAKHQQAGGQVYESLSAWVAVQFERRNSLIFVAATGIAVRAIAPYVRDKLTDPAVISVDEYGCFVVPLLSGHVGGANALAQRVARAIDAVPVISTATDLNGAFAVDSWATAQGMHIQDRKAAKAISAALLAGEKVGFSSELAHDTLPKGVTEARERYGFAVSYREPLDLPQNWLLLRPKVLTVGIGCKKNLPMEQVSETVQQIFQEYHLCIQSVGAVVSIDLKREDAGILHLAKMLNVPCHFYTAEQLKAVQGSFSASGFVRSVTGVDNVCERSAVLASHNGQLLVTKQARNGVTVAVACAQKKLCFEQSEGGGQNK